MAILTTDVVTNVVSGVEVSKNATCVVYCYNTGEYGKREAEQENNTDYVGLDTTYGNRFDDVAYYVTGGV